MDTKCSSQVGGKIACLFSLILSLPVSAAYAAESTGAEVRYQELCAGCHGADFSHGFSNGRWLRSGSDEDLIRVIRDGLPEQGMPAFGRALREEEIRSFVSLLRERTAAAPSMIGVTIDAETFNRERSAGVGIQRSESRPDLRYLAWFSRGNHACFDDIDLTGVRGLDVHYAKGDGEPPRRFAVIVFDERTGTRINLGEKITRSTGGWETFRTHRIGLSGNVTGRRRLCFVGMEGGGVFNLERFTLSDQPGENDGITAIFDVSREAISAAGHRFRLEKIAEVPGQPWSMDFLDDNLIAVTQKTGSLWLFRTGARMGPISGTPRVESSGQGGLLAVRAHPDYANNRWLYLTYAEPGPNGAAMTRVARGRLEELSWVNEQTIYHAPAELYSEAGEHFGAQLTFHGDFLYFSIGDRGQRELAQDLRSPLGKIHRLHIDGRVPADNPFVGNDGAQPSIWSYGHRNPQGLAVHPTTRELWSAEHGPRGGDEINLIRKGLNYGWPVVTFGINYDGTPISDATHREGIEPPRHHWTPSIGVSAVRFCTCAPFPKWRNHLLVASLTRQELHLLHIESDRVTKDEVVLEGMGKIRDVTIGPDGHPYVVLNPPGAGEIYRLVPAPST